MRDIFIFTLVAIVSFLGLSFSMIFAYVSPDNVPHLLSSGIVLLSTSIFLFSYLYQTSSQLNTILKLIIIILSIAFIIKSFLLGMAVDSIYFKEFENSTPAKNMIYSSIVIVSIGIFFLGRRMGKKIELL